MIGDPRWANINEDVRTEILGLIAKGMNIGANKRFREVSGLDLARSKAAVEDIIVTTEFSPCAEGGPCPRCGKALRTNLAQQCFHCGADWHASLSAF
jgi:hypothetical protein